ncbi:MAG: uracil-DNA glycosylase [Candidatus Methylacidiphilales bacterium]
MVEAKKISTLKDAVVRYLDLRRCLGESRVTLSKNTVVLIRASASSAGDRERVRPAPASKTLDSRGQVAASTTRKEPAPAKPVTALKSVIRNSPHLGNVEEKSSALEQVRLRILADDHVRSFFPRSRNMVFGSGPADARLMFIGEAPGAEEDAQGVPFVGPAGQLLTKMITAMGLKREEVYITNVVKYRPEVGSGGWGNRKPTHEELEACLPYVLEQVAIIKPEVVVGLGATAMEGLLQQERVSINRLRGIWHDLDGLALMPTFHPAYLLHNSNIAEKRKVWEDLLQVMGRLALPISEKQQRYFQSSSS